MPGLGQLPTPNPIETVPFRLGADAKRRRSFVEVQDPAAWPAESGLWDRQSTDYSRQ